MKDNMLQRRGAFLFIGAATLTLAVAVAGGRVASAQGPQEGSPQATAAFDMTGYWVSVVNEDWRWRMVTPPKGDVASVPLNDAGREAANNWDEATDGSCLAYGAGGLMRIPTRIRIMWESDDVMMVETDAGMQTRRYMFAAGAAPGARSLQGFSKAEWERLGGGRGRPPVGGNLKVVTNNLSGGWLRKNGVPYSQDAVVTEYWDTFMAPNDDRWLLVTTIVDDPTYLNQPFYTSTHFKYEPDGSKWDAVACRNVG